MTKRSKLLLLTAAAVVLVLASGLVLALRPMPRFHVIAWGFFLCAGIFMTVRGANALRNSPK